MFWKASQQPVEVNSFFRWCKITKTTTKEERISWQRRHVKTLKQRYTPALKVCCVTAFAWVETNNLHSHYTCFYVQEFFKRYMAVGKTFLPFFFSHFLFPQFCEMDAGKLIPHTSRPMSSSAFQLIPCVLTLHTSPLPLLTWSTHRSTTLHILWSI